MKGRRKIEAAPGASAAPADNASSIRRPGGPIRTAGKVLGVLRVTLASRLTYAGEVLIRSIFLCMILYTFLQLWRTTDLGTSVLETTGFTIAQLLWYLAFTEAMILSLGYIAESEVDKEVRSGDVAYRLSRPLAYPLHHLGAQMGERLFRFALNLFVGSAVVLFFVGPIPFAPLAVVAALVAGIVALTIDWMVSFSISLTSFWVEDSFGLHLLYRRLVMLLGGVLIPLEAFPGWLERIARGLPFQYLAYHPARLFVQGNLDGAVPLFAVQAALLAAGILPMMLVYSLGLRRVSSQGG